MEDDWNTLTHRVCSRQKWLRSACSFRCEACDFQPKRMRLIERKIASSGHSLIKSYSSNWYMIGEVFTSTTAWKPKNCLF